MSKENVVLFFEKVREIKELQQKLERIQESDTADLVAESVKLGAEYGFEFTEEEMRGGLQELSVASVEEGELSDEQLEAVAGGGCPYCIFTKGSYCIFTGKL